MIEYRIRLADPARHLLEVDCSVQASAGELCFEMPSWSPGSYLLREYARHVVAVRATDADGAQLEVEKQTHNRWRCETTGGQVTLTAVIYALDESVRGAWFDMRRVFINGPCVFMQVQGAQTEPVSMHIERPSGEFARDWSVATAMQADAIDAQGFGAYAAASYDELLDHPVEIGDLDRIEFEVEGVRHSIVVAGRHDADLQRFAADLKKICAAQMNFFGLPVPFDRYTFLCAAVAKTHGGLEHRNSSALMFPRAGLPGTGDKRITSAYERTLSLASHEYFHTWHVKRTRPAAFMPYALSERNFTRQLWVFEGITSYYQDRFPLRCGLFDQSTYLRRLAAQISSVLRVPGRHVQSLADSSFDAWDKLYKPDANSQNATVSYYSKGALVALALDLHVRSICDGEVSLDTIVQALWREFGAQDRGVPETGFEDLAVELAGERLREFFDTCIRGTDDPPLKSLFAQFGIEMQLSAAAKDRADEPSVWLGIVPGHAAHGVEATVVLDGGPAQRAGMNPGDRIIAVDRLRVAGAANMLGRRQPGDVAVVSAFRGDELLEFEVLLAAPPKNHCRLQVDAEADAAAVQRRQDWLCGGG